MVKGFCIGVMCLVAGPVLADPMTHVAAAKLMFAPSGVQVSLVPGAALPKEQAGPLKTVLAQQPYYGAAALSPDEGLMSEATIFVGNFHSADMASQAALVQCNAKRKGKTACVIVATVAPKGWKARPLQLSQAATAGLKTGYPKVGGGMAISAATGDWALAGDAATALANCKASKDKPKDCALVIEN